MRFSEDQIGSIKCADGILRDLHIWQPTVPKGVMVALHGGMAHGGDSVTAARYFKQKQWTTISPDLRGHDRKRIVHINRFDDLLDDLALLLDKIKADYPGLPVIIIAHSMGALLATHFALSRLPPGDGSITGFVMSSPFYANAIRVNKILQLLSGLIAGIAPKMPVPISDFTDQLTHDRDITRRHRQDVEDQLRATGVSARFANELLKAQCYVADNIQRWHHPLFMVLAGEDYLADVQISRQLTSRIDRDLMTQLEYPENYHENFNELNREAIFDRINRWLPPGQG